MQNIIEILILKAGFANIAKVNFGLNMQHNNIAAEKITLPVMTTELVKCYGTKANTLCRNAGWQMFYNGRRLVQLPTLKILLSNYIKTTKMNKESNTTETAIDTNRVLTTVFKSVSELVSELDTDVWLGDERSKKLTSDILDLIEKNRKLRIPIEIDEKSGYVTMIKDYTHLSINKLAKLPSIAVVEFDQPTPHARIYTLDEIIETIGSVALNGC